MRRALLQRLIIYGSCSFMLITVALLIHASVRQKTYVPGDLSAYQQVSQSPYSDTPNINKYNLNENIFDLEYLERLRRDLVYTARIPSHSTKTPFITADSPYSATSYMPQMANETLRTELGRSTWRLLHTMASRFPVEPSIEQIISFELFIVLLGRLYPCGECASHFQTLLKSMPPRLNSRQEAVEWICKAHNVVNRRLEKPLFDCDRALDAWQCGCADGQEYRISKPKSAHLPS